MSSPAEDSLEKLIADVREIRLVDCDGAPSPGDLVFEPWALRRVRDAIGWVVAHDEAPYGDDPNEVNDVREVWDVRPLSGAEGSQDGAQRWENADFYALPTVFAARALKLKRKDPTDG